MEQHLRFPRRRSELENSPPDRVYSDPYDVNNCFKVDQNQHSYVFSDHEEGLVSAVDNIVKG